MPVTNMSPLSIELSGAPDDFIDTPEAKSSAVQVMHIDLTQAVLDDLLQCTRDGKPPHILFGRNPVRTRDVLTPSKPWPRPHLLIHFIETGVWRQE
jgi:hypothetical protein